MSRNDSNIFDAVSAARLRTTKEDARRRLSFSVVLFAVFVVMDLLALMTGASSYGSITRMQAANDQRIMTLGPIASSIRANDAANSVTTGKGPEGPSLVLMQSDSQGTYETRIYLYQGNIVQEFALEGSPYRPEKATVLAPSSSFEFTQASGLLTVTTDVGTIDVALRHQQGGA